MADKFVTKDSGKRQEFSTGMKRDTAEDKLRYDLIPIEILDRLAGLYTRGAKKYDAWNWMKAATKEELARFKESAWRHFMQFMHGEIDEDHFAGTIFNLYGMIYVKKRTKK